ETLPEYDDNKINPNTLTGTIEVSHVSFRYKEDGPLVLQDVCFTREEGGRCYSEEGALIKKIGL
ncbi:MAG: hypothetical protein ACYC21_06265, partial [Eubacteriales bacterium]